MMESETIDLGLSEQEIRDGAPFAALSYVLFLWIFVFFAPEKNKFAHFHARQGIVLFLLEIACGFLSLIPFLGFIFYLAGMIGFTLLGFYGIYNALTGKAVKLPIVGSIAAKLVV